MLSRHILDGMGFDNPKIGMAENQFASIYTSQAFAQQAGQLTNDNLSVNLIFKNENHVGENIDRLKQDLSFSETQPYVQSPAFTDNYGNITTYIALLVIIVFLMFTGYLLIYNVMYISVSRDVRFYGMLKTLGTTPRQLRRIVIGQIMCLCIIGLPIGCAASAAISLFVVPAILQNSGIDTGAVVSFSPAIYICAVLFAILTALISAATPAKKAANITPIEALKFTGEEICKSNVRFSAHGKPYRMAMRNIFRDQKRAAVVILSLSLGITVFTTIMTIVMSMDIDHRVNCEYDYDFSFSSNITSSYYLSDDFISEINGLSGITEAGVTTLEHAELIYSESLDKFVNWQQNVQNLENVVTDNVFNMEYGIRELTR